MEPSHQDAFEALIRILNIEDREAITKDMLKKMYRAAALKLHPDKQKGENDPAKNEQFKELSAAWDMIKNLSAEKISELVKHKPEPEFVALLREELCYLDQLKVNRDEFESFLKKNEAALRTCSNPGYWALVMKLQDGRILKALVNMETGFTGPERLDVTLKEMRCKLVEALEMDRRIYPYVSARTQREIISNKSVDIEKLGIKPESLKGLLQEGESVLYPLNDDPEYSMVMTNFKGMIHSFRVRNKDGFVEFGGRFGRVRLQDRLDIYQDMRGVYHYPNPMLNQAELLHRIRLKALEELLREIHSADPKFANKEPPSVDYQAAVGHVHIDGSKLSEGEREFYDQHLDNVVRQITGDESYEVNGAGIKGPHYDTEYIMRGDIRVTVDALSQLAELMKNNRDEVLSVVKHAAKSGLEKSVRADAHESAPSDLRNERPKLKRTEKAPAQGIFAHKEQLKKITEAKTQDKPDENSKPKPGRS